MKHLQTILQFAENQSPDLLGFVNNELPRIFGPINSMFINTTPKEFLFDGVEFCTNRFGIPGIVCRQVKDRNSTTIRETESGSLKFSFFSHVRI